jgi:hypothetical protein
MLNIHHLAPCFSEINVNIPLFTPISFKWYLSFGFSDQNLRAVFKCPSCHTWNVRFIYADFITLAVFGDCSWRNTLSSPYPPPLEAQRSYVWRGSAITRTHTPLDRTPDEKSARRRGRYCFLLDHNIPNTLFSRTLNARDEVHCLCEVKCKTSVSYITHFTFFYRICGIRILIWVVQQPFAKCIS